MDKLLVESFGRFVAGACTPAVVREVERTRDASALWAQVEGSGYLDALVPESAGGAGLGLRDAFGLWLACGQHALPVPLAQTMWARGVLAAAGAGLPDGPIAIASSVQRDADGTLRCAAAPFGAVAAWVLAGDGEHAWLLPTAQALRSDTGVHGSLQAHLQWPQAALAAAASRSTPPLLEAAALITATLMAGAMQRVLDSTLVYANERAQFGKPIGRFQAVQQQLAVLAEQAFAARIAAELGCAESTLVPQPLRAEVAKARAAEAAEKLVAIAHAVHGAIGVTAEFDLQLFTRRLQEWRGDHGAASFWHLRLGRALLAADASSVPFLLEQLLPPAGARGEA